MNQNVFEKYIIPWSGALWFLVAIDSFFLWGSFGIVFRAISFGGMIISSMKLSNKFHSNTNNWTVLISLLLYVFWLFSFISNNVLIAVKAVDFVGFFLLLFWPREEIGKCYALLRKIIVFFAIGSSVVSVLSFVGVLQYLPHFTFEGRSTLHQSKGISYYVYGTFVTLHSRNGLVSARACGPLQEPGHWAIIIGFFYLIEWFTLKKRNLWIIVGGILTFSSGFLLIFLFAEFMNLFSKAAVKKTIYLILFFLGLSLVYVMLPQNIKKDVGFLFFERNLESVYENYGETGTIQGALNARAADYSLNKYYDLKAYDYLFGYGYRDSADALSDYRGTILFIGLIGLILSIIPSVLIVRRSNWRLRIALILSMTLVYLHRGWMFYAPYIYFLAFLAVTLSYLPLENDDNELVKDRI
ncbi:MAG: hypothetical protein PUB29_02680 [Bacteroidales bacterium]|nr:hypothetical protein [Bacteroidales bacterium]